MIGKGSKKMPIVYSDSYYVEIGDHVFPTSKYKIIKERLDLDVSLKNKYEIVAPITATEEQVLTVHTPEYIGKLKNGTLDTEEIFTLELPYSEALVEASFMTCGGTITAARKALEVKASVHLGGGFHHAFPDHGEGFCVLNDVAVSIKALQSEGFIKKALVVDCDLHQGNGTAFIFKNDPNVYTFSIHQQNNYPFHKPESDMDIGLRDFTDDDIYLKHLHDNVPDIITAHKPDLIIYVAGADPYKDDQLGNLMLTKNGLRKRDNFVLTQAHNFGIPVAVTLAGGYAYNREDTVDIHYGTIKECIEVFAR